VLPGFQEYKGTHTDTSKSNLNWPIQTLPPPKSWEIWKKLIWKRFLLSKLGCLGTTMLEDPLGHFLQTHDNHCTWHWEQTGANSIVENTYLFDEHQQVHYSAQFTRHQIKVNKKDILHKIQPIINGHHECSNQQVLLSYLPSLMEHMRSTTYTSLNRLSSAICTR
jgi:hypothetical protein